MLTMIFFIIFDVYKHLFLCGKKQRKCIDAQFYFEFCRSHDRSQHQDMVQLFQRLLCTQLLQKAEKVTRELYFTFIIHTTIKFRRKNVCCNNQTCQWYSNKFIKIFLFLYRLQVVVNLVFTKTGKIVFKSTGKLIRTALGCNFLTQ